MTNSARDPSLQENSLPADLEYGALVKTKGCGE